MKRILALCFALALLTAFAAAAEEGVAMRVIACPEQGFSTLCKPEYQHDFTPDGGLAIALGPDDGAPFVAVFKTDAPGADFDADYYLTHVYNERVQNYGDVLTGPVEAQTFPLGDRELIVGAIIGF